jgi:hypothetical protein
MCHDVVTNDCHLVAAVATNATAINEHAIRRALAFGTCKETREGDLNTRRLQLLRNLTHAQSPI